MLTQLECPPLEVRHIQYLPTHRCPRCDAPALPNPEGGWFTPWLSLGRGRCALDAWRDHIAYVRFACDCHPRGSLRVARLGDAIIPLHFASLEEARRRGVPLDQLNAARVRQAVDFLAKHALPRRTAESDALAHIVYALAAGAIGPEAALRKLRAAWHNPNRENHV